MKLIDDAIREGRTTLSEYESKQVLASYRIPVTIEELVDNPEDLFKAAAKIGYPVVMKERHRFSYRSFGKTGCPGNDAGNQGP